MLRRFVTFSATCQITSGSPHVKVLLLWFKLRSSDYLKICTCLVLKPESQLPPPPPSPPSLVWPEISTHPFPGGGTTATEEVMFLVVGAWEGWSNSQQAVNWRSPRDPAPLLLPSFIRMTPHVPMSSPPPPPRVSGLRTVEFSISGKYILLHAEKVVIPLDR
jgi:hypothetical protein